MIIIDVPTRHRPFELARQRRSRRQHIRSRLRKLPPDDVATSIISYEEQIRGWTARIASAPSVERQLLAYSELKSQLKNYCSIAIEQFDESALVYFNQLKLSRVKIGTMDVKIASIALAKNMILLTRNTRDFSKIPGLMFEDWSI